MPVGEPAAVAQVLTSTDQVALDHGADDVMIAARDLVCHILADIDLPFLVPDELSDLVASCLEKKPDKRPQEMREVGAALAKAVSDAVSYAASAGAVRETAPHRQRRGTRRSRAA